MTRGLYVYGVVETGSLTSPPRARGVDPDDPLTLFPEGALTAVAGGVDVREFEGEALERNAETPEWLERKVRAHECVLDEVLASTTVVPMRFGSIFSTPDGLREMLATHAATFGAALDRVRARTEWGVKVHCEREQLVGALAGAAGEPATGRGYLQQKKALLDAEARAAVVADTVAAGVHASLSALAADAVSLPARGAVLNGAYLVDNAARETFMRRVEELGQRHGAAFLFEVTGPWPPYNFTSADVGGPRE